MAAGWVDAMDSVVAGRGGVSALLLKKPSEREQRVGRAAWRNGEEQDQQSVRQISWDSGISKNLFVKTRIGVANH